MNNKIDKLLITGAGFSYHLGLPHTNEIIKFLIEPDESLNCDIQFNDFINEVKKFFNNGITIKEDKKFLILNADELNYKINEFEMWDLEVMFDYLYFKMRKKETEAIKIYKMLSWLIFFVIEEKSKFKNLNYLANSYLLTYDVLTTNWDIFLDQILRNNFPKLGDCFSYNINYGLEMTLHPKHSDCNSNATKQKKIIKFHGSANWAYCVKCKKNYYSNDKKLALYTNCGLTITEYSKINNNATICEKCNEPLNIVAKNFGKNKLNSPREIYSLLKQEAENLLKKHNNWVIVGHSFRDDDVDFLNLLQKHCSSKNIDIISKDDIQIKEMSKQYLEKATVKYYNCGLENYIEKKYNN